MYIDSLMGWGGRGITLIGGLVSRANSFTREEGSSVMPIRELLQCFNMQHLQICYKHLAPDWPVCTLQRAPTN